MSWLLRVEDTIYFMQGGTNQYTDKIEIQINSYESLKSFSAKVQGWLTGKDAPGTFQTSTVHPEKYATGKPPGTSEPWRKPVVIKATTPNKSSRNGEPIKRIILHYTTSRNVDGTISWFANPASQVSAHYVIDQNGKIYQCVPDSEKAWHCYGNNADSIGIEHAAAQGDTLTPAQEKATVALQSWLLSEYKLPKAAISAHRFVSGGTDCPGSLWKTEAELQAWVEKNVLVKEPEKKSLPTALIMRTGAKYNSGRWRGLEVLELQIGDEIFQVCSGQPYAQNFRKPGHALSVPGNMEPIPQGLYTIGIIEWANGKDNYNATWGEGLGPVWVSLTAQFSDDRNSFGLHIDAGAQSTAGCIGLLDVEQAKKVVDALRKHDPKTLIVNWEV